MYVQEEHVVEEHVIANVRAADLNYHTRSDQLMRLNLCIACTSEQNLRLA